MPDVCDGGIDHVGGGDPLPVDLDRGRVDARHVEDVLEQARQPVELGDGRAGLRATLVGRQVAAQVLDGHPDDGQRCPEVVAQRRQQRRRQIRLLPDEVGRVTFRQELGPFDRDGDDARDGVEGADIECR